MEPRTAFPMAPRPSICGIPAQTYEILADHAQARLESRKDRASETG